MELVVSANRTILGASDLSMSQDIDFALEIIEANKDIPFILLNDDGSISQSRNLGFKGDGSFRDVPPAEFMAER